jgi:predicted amidophosphoribosyltransferase
MSEALEIDRNQILAWIRQKLIILSDKNDALICKRCGEPVSGGTLCDRCKLLLSHDVDQGIKAIKESMPSPLAERKGMHYTREERENRFRS